MTDTGNHASPRDAYDWSSSDLGDPATWPHTLKLSVDIVLASPWPMLLDWGEQHITVCNNAYAELAASRFVRVPGGKVPALSPPPMAAAMPAFALAHAGQPQTLPRQALTFLRDSGPEQLDVDLQLLPLRDEAGAVRGVLCMLAPSAPLSTLTAGASLRVLVVEDNLDSQYLVCEMLRAFGHEPVGSGDAESALKLLGGQTFDVLFSDVSLPGMSGVELARLALQSQPQLQVIFASGYGAAMLRHVEFAYQSLQKPYEIDQLQDALGKIVRRGPGGV